VADARAAGWVNDELPDVPALARHACELARELAGHPRGAVATVKHVLRRGAPDQLAPPTEHSWNEE
jgi:enoyl-CoA hydratase/carnithine racemase